MRRVRPLAILAILSVILGGCASDTDDAELPNPAAVYCEDQGGTVTGSEPMCTLPDGATVDAWDLYRENNPPDDG